MNNIHKVLLICIAFASLSDFAKSGLNKYTILDKIDNWIIERKIEPESNEILCRASVLSDGTWFGSRMRLGQSDELILPNDLSHKETPSELKLQPIRMALNKCRKDFIY